ncbi:hypothetical protein [Salegentibacter sp. F14]
MQNSIFFILFVVSSQLCAQEMNQWSGWEENPIFSELQTRYRLVPQNEERVKIDLESRNNFNHELVVYLELRNKDGKGSIVKLLVPPTREEPYSAHILIKGTPKSIKNSYAHLKPHWELSEIN